MIPIAEALALCTERIAPLPAETVPLQSGLGRVLAEPARAVTDLPPFPQSGMDGYAVVAADTADASEGTPLRLRLVGEIPAGTQPSRPRLAPGEAMRIFTGGVVPEGADAVVRQEVVETDGDGVLLREPVPAGNNVRGQGEELRAGAPLLDAGQRLTPGRLASLAAAGVERMAVARRPAVRVIGTGDEIRPAGGELPLGAVYDANGPLLRSWLQERGYADVRVDYVADDEASHREAIAAALEEGDVVVTTGGVSVGDRDLVIPVAESLGVERVFWRVRQKPGKPLYLGVSGRGVPLLGLPGNPATVFVGATVYLRRILDCLEGVRRPGPQLRPGIAAAPVPRDGKRDCWIRGRWETDAEGRVQLTPLGGQASHMLSNLAEADALLFAPAGPEPSPAGTVVEWLPLG